MERKKETHSRKISFSVVFIFFPLSLGWVLYLAPPSFVCYMLGYGVYGDSDFTTGLFIFIFFHLFFPLSLSLLLFSFSFFVWSKSRRLDSECVSLFLVLVLVLVLFG